MSSWFKGILSVSLGAIGLVALSASALADHEVGHDEVARGGILALEQRIWDLEQILLNLPGAQEPVTVDCDIGDSIQAALDTGATDITVTGACNESVSIFTDDVVLNGSGTASIVGDGSSAAIDIAADRIVIADWASVEGGASFGIRVGGSGSATISNVASIKGSRGVLVTESAFANIVDSSLSNNQTGSPGDGLFVQLGGNAALQGSSFSGNNARGILIVNTGSVSPMSDNSIDGNDSDGIRILHGALTIRSDGANNTVSGNGVVTGLEDVRCFNFSRIFVGTSLANTGGTSVISNCIVATVGGPLFTP